MGTLPEPCFIPLCTKTSFIALCGGSPIPDLAEFWAHAHFSVGVHIEYSLKAGHVAVTLPKEPSKAERVPLT